ncbi:MAG: NAD-dependent deacylase [Bacteroidales bacterium]|nr:NAD-dependent deacylase [Bacteroidales bacterium]
MKKLVVLTGAGISAESGLRTFREMGGLWEEYDVYEVASPQGWTANKELVLRFYNDRRKQLYEVEPNAGHLGLVELEKYFDVEIITQNIDDLHERAGSSKILHLHGEIKKARSTVDPSLVYEIKGWELNIGDKCEKGSQLRPHVVWFGEAVPAFQQAVEITEKADIFVVVGTSLNVYPAAGLIDFVPINSPVYLIDPNGIGGVISRKIVLIKEKATVGVPMLIEKLINEGK